MCLPGARLSALEGADQVDGVPDTFLPLASNLHAGLVGVQYQESCRRQLQVVFLHEVLGGPVEGIVRRRIAQDDTYLKGPRPLDICGEQESVGPPSSL